MKGLLFLRMILYNVTVGIDKEIEAVWVEWMKTTHIPEVLKTGTFIKYKFYKVLSHDDEGSVSYCIQYFTPTLEKFNLYLKDYAPALMEHHRAKFDGKHVAFLTLLEEV
ncbi:MAG TPA: DUF4286 family protein [Cyclobacteriaceae bacterium]|jgi:hypothetical protein|nr:DUF4286 family protein [Cyclobacteriaceae bacterium]